MVTAQHWSLIQPRPCAVLAVLAERRLTVTWLASQTRYSLHHVNEVINERRVGSRQFMADIARALDLPEEAVFPVNHPPTA